MSWAKGKPKGYRTPVIERVMAKVSEGAGGCWVWGGTTNGIGYGTIGTGGKYGRSAYVHRVTYEHFIAGIPDGLVLDHLCRTPICCNPWHLEPVTQRVNLLRGETAPSRCASAVACSKGHPYTPENTYRRPSAPNERRCRTCAREWQQQLRDARKETA